MKLLDAAEVKTGTGNWTRGWDGDSRACSGLSVYLSECDPDATSDVIGEEDAEETDEECGYRVIPFGIVAQFRRSTRNARDDDAAWLARSLREGAEVPVARGLLVRQGMGLSQTAAAGGGVIATDVWLGSPNVESIPAPALTDNVAVADAIADGRALFFQRTLGIQPILHVNPGMAIRLKNAGVVELDPDNGEDRTAWGDPVVISEGYSDIPGMTASPIAFWTGPIEITLSDVNQEEIIRATRQNKLVHQVTMLAAIDTPPCAIVLIGDAPTPVAP